MNTTNLDFLSKEDCATWTYVYSQEFVSKEIRFMGRTYYSEETDSQKVMFVGKLFKVKDKTDGSEHKILMCGKSVQHPADVFKKSVGLQIAYERALIDPFMVVEVPDTFKYYDFKSLMNTYACNLNLKPVYTTEERKAYNSMLIEKLF